MAVGHLGQAGRVDGRRDVGVHGLDGGERGHLGLVDAEPADELDGVAHDGGLGREVRVDVDGGVGDRQQLGIGGQLEHEAVRHPPGGAQVADDGMEERRGVDVALDEPAHLARGDEVDADDRGGVLVGRVDDREAIGARDLVDLGGDGGERADEGGLDDAGVGRFGDPGQHRGIGGPDDGDRQRG
jgi:hypothetical protein